MAASPPPHQPRIGLLDERPLFAAAVFACIALSLAAELARAAAPDTALMLYAAGRLLDGATLYRDVVEINPPLIIWLNVPIEAVARATHVSEFILYRLVVAGVVGSLFGLCYRIVRRYVLPDRPADGRYLLLLLCFALFPLAADDFGQREHLVLALLAPNLLLVAARLRGAALRGTGPEYAELVLVGVLSGVALALKPQFALAWLALVAFQPASGRWRLSTELIWTLLFLGAYAVAVLLAAPDYLQMVALVGSSYVRFLREPWYSVFLLAPGAPLVFVALLAAFALRRYSRDPALWALLAAEVASCYLSGVVQQKGLRYHFYPAFALAFVLLGIVAADAPVAAERISERLYGRVARVLAATVALVVLGASLVDVVGGTPADRQKRAEFKDLVGFVQAHSGGRPVGVLSYHMGGAFPLVNYAGVSLASRFPCLWLLPTSYWDSLEAGGALVYRAPAEMDPSEKYLWDAVRQDLMTAQPGLILVLRPTRDVPRNGLRRLNYIRYFARDPELGALFQRYQLAAEKGEYDIYERIADRTKRVGPAPSIAPGTFDVAEPQLHKVRFQILEPGFLAGMVVFAAVWGLSLALDGRRTRMPY